MPIRYGDLTIIYDQSNLFINFLVWMQAELRPPPNSKYILLFDNGDICDTDTKTDFNFKFLNSSVSALPIYFDKNTTSYNTTYFCKKTNDNPIDPNKLFSSYSKYESFIPSEYNGIYYCYKNLDKPEVFGLIRIKSNANMPHYQFAYDSDEFTRDELIYLIHSIFNPTN